MRPHGAPKRIKSALLHASTLLRVTSLEIRPSLFLPSVSVSFQNRLHTPIRSTKKDDNNEESNPRSAVAPHAHRTGRRDDAYPPRRARRFRIVRIPIFLPAPAVKGTGDFASAFPAGTNAAATRDLGLVGSHGKAMGSKHKDKGVHIALGPMSNLGFGADPFLTGAASVATSNGYQGVGVIATVKHL
ncbi:hypothetical protein C8R44DRAFT_886879 [Mycena epipterygia]|nr:hypothetical protein C8R44DRAFT_886879 [Mycena epipterygia]